MTLRRLAARALLVLMALLLAYAVWPTPWHTAQNCGQLIRVNRFTNRVTVLTDTGWVLLQGNPFRDLGQIERRQQGLPPTDPSLLPCQQFLQRSRAGGR